MTGKKFAIIESSMIIGLIGIFAINILVHQNGEKDNETHISMDYYGNVLFEGEDNFKDNVWLRMIKEEFNFTPVIDSAVSTTDYETKINTAIGANNLSDIFSININQFSGLNKSSQIYDDLTSVYDKYASDELKAAMGWDNELKQNSKTFKKWVVDGKLRAIPSAGSNYSNCSVLFIRKDWLDQIGYDVPKTLNDVERILFKFKENGLGKGLAANQEILFTNAGSLDFVFNAYGSYPTLFVYDKDGHVDFGCFSQETKVALEKLQYWYANGLIYSEFAQTTSETLGNKVANGEIGVIYGDMSIPLWRCSTCITNFADAEFVCVPAPSFDANTPTTVGIKSSGNEAYVVRNKYSHPERLVQMMNLYHKSMYSDSGDFERFNPFCQAYPVWMEPVDKNYYRTKEIKVALDKDRELDTFKDSSIQFVPDMSSYKELEYNKLNTEAKFYYRNVRDYFIHNKKYNGGTNWAYTRIFYSYEDEDGLTMVNGKKGFDCSFSAIDKYAINNLVKYSVYDGVDTPSYSNNRRTIETKITDTMIKIIKGGNIKLFDTTVSQIREGWAKAVLAEIEEELAKGNK